MILKIREWAKCPTCGRNEKLIQDDVYGCDNCKNQIGKKPGSDYLRMTVFHKDGNSEYCHLCSWECVFKKLKKLKTDYFIELPFLTFDTNSKKMMVKDFWKAIKEYV